MKDLNELSAKELTELRSQIDKKLNEINVGDYFIRMECFHIEVLLVKKVTGDIIKYQSDILDLHTGYMYDETTISFIENFYVKIDKDMAEPLREKMAELTLRIDQLRKEYFKETKDVLSNCGI